MKVEDIPFVEAEPVVEEVPTEVVETPEIDPKQEKLFKNMAMRRFHSVLVAIDRELYLYNLTLEELRDEIVNKKSRLSRNQRDFVMGFKLDFVQELIDELNASRGTM